LGLQPSPIINIHLPALLMLQVTVSWFIAKWIYWWPLNK
jgi:hypothetical protein